MLLRLVLGLLITVVGLAIAGRRVWWLYRLIRSGQPVTGRLKDVRARLEAEVAEVAGAATEAGLDPKLMELVKIRASQLNGCAFCTDMHSRDARQLGETERRIFVLPVWADTELFTEQERAALALTEAATRLADRPDPVPDEVWNEAAEHYDEQALAYLLIEIAAINAFNRLSVPTRQPSGRKY